MDIKRNDIDFFQNMANMEDLRIKSYDLPLARYVLKHKKASTLYSKYGKMEFFVGENSNHYVSHFQKHKFQPEKLGFKRISLDSAANCGRKKESIVCFRPDTDYYYFELKERYWRLRNYLADFFRGFASLRSGSVRGLSAARMWNLSMISSIIFGMFTMTMIYRYLGQSVSARIQAENTAEQTQEYKNSQNDEGEDGESDVDLVAKLLEDYEKFKNQELENEIREMVKGYPIEKMVPEIAKKDRIVAAFLISIAKKESNWGKRVPVLRGNDCYNYWGYRGVRDKMGTGGHTCFNSPEDAVNTVAKRIDFLVSSEKLNTPAKMKIWKCGYDCSWDNPGDVRKWISDVSIYFKKLNKE